ncbi:hypothetical protein H4R35_003659 [Dimargaris xerosporica]|nr:hypothetical protein H4R35_003659 [Dimargaris xerosporica]
MPWVFASDCGSVMGDNARLSVIDVERDKAEEDEEEEPQGQERYDVVYENQRGLYLFGIPKFNNKMLLPHDPPAWHDGSNFAVTDINSYQLPDPSWEWVYDHWCIDMSDDVDEDGWQYSISYGWSWWHGSHKVWKSFVRRRRWIRLRRKQGRIGLSQQRQTPEIVLSSQASATPGDSAPVDLIALLQTAKVDRQRLEIIQAWMESDLGAEIIQTLIPYILPTFDYESSKLKCLQIFEENNLGPGQYKYSIQPPAFYSDRKRLDGILDPTPPPSRPSQ